MSNTANEFNKQNESNKPSVRERIRNPVEDIIKAQNDDLVMEELIKRNEGLIKKIANTFYNTGVDFNDLVQVGSWGLAKGIRTFDPSLNKSPSSYFGTCITNEILATLRSGEGQIIKTSYSDRAKTRALLEKLGEDFSTKNFDEVVGEDYKERYEAAQLLKIHQGVISLDEKLGNQEQDDNRYNFIPSALDKYDVDDDSSSSNKSSSTPLRQAAKKLKGARAQLYHLEYSLGHSRKYTCKTMGLSEETLKTIEENMRQELAAYMRGEEPNVPLSLNEIHYDNNENFKELVKTGKGKKAIKELKELEQNVLFLMCLENATQQGVADQLGISRSYVARIETTALKKLQPAIDEMYADKKKETKIYTDVYNPTSSSKIILADKQKKIRKQISNLMLGADTPGQVFASVTGVITDQKLSNKQIETILSIIPLSPLASEYAPIYFGLNPGSKPLVKSSEISQAGYYPRTFLDLAISVNEGCSNPEIRNIIECYKKGDPIDSARIAALQSEQALWRSHPKQMDLINNRIGILSCRLLTEQEWDRILDIRNVTDIERKVFKLFYGVCGEEEKIQLIDLKLKKELKKEKAETVLKRLRSKLGEKKRAVVRDYIRNILQGNPEEIISHNTVKDQETILSTVIRAIPKRILCKDEWDIIFSLINASDNLREGITLRFGLDRDCVERTDTETTIIMDKKHGDISHHIRNLEKKLDDNFIRGIIKDMTNDIFTMTDDIKQEIEFNKNHLRHFKFIEDVTAKPVKRLLTKKEWDAVFDKIGKVFKAGKHGGATYDEFRQFFHWHHGTEGKECDRYDTCNLFYPTKNKKDVDNIYTSLRGTFFQNYKDDLRVLIEQISDGVPLENLKLTYKNEHKFQLNLIQLLTGTRADKTIENKVWENVLNGKEFTDLERLFAKLQYGLTDKGELESADILVELNKSTPREEGKNEENEKNIEYNLNDLENIRRRVQRKLKHNKYFAEVLEKHQLSNSKTNSRSAQL